MLTKHAPQPCNVMHGFRATACTFFCARQRRSACTAAVQGTLHGFSATQDNLYRTTNPVMHYVQDGRNPYRTLRQLPYEYPTTKVTPDRTREMEVASHG